MVTLAEPITRDELSRLVEDGKEPATLDVFVRSLDFSIHEQDVIIDSFAALPDLSTGDGQWPSKAPDMFDSAYWF